MYQKEVERRLAKKQKDMDEAIDTKSKINGLSYICLHSGVINKLN